MSALGATAVLLAVAMALGGCESTQDKSARLSKQGVGKQFAETGLKIRQASRQVKIGATTVLSDSNGAAVAVALRNNSPKPLVNVPLAINVLDKRGKSVFKNDTAGIEPSLTTASYIGPRSDFVWVNDQVQADNTPARVRAVAGRSAPSDLAAPPAISVTSAKLQIDPTDGPEAIGGVGNASKITQLKLILFAVARKGGRIVAAGRGEIPRLKPGRHAQFRIFFIGNPKGAQISVAAPPTTFK